jgi:hypothetical protein
MDLSQAPCWGCFTFNYKGIDIYVPAFLNNVARYKPDTFWDWLIYTKYPRQTSVVFTYDNMVEQEKWQINHNTNLSNTSLSR